MFGNCQRPVFSLGVSQHKHKITNLWKYGLDWSLDLQENNERKIYPCLNTLCASRCINGFRSSLLLFGQEIISFSNYVTSEGAVFHNVLYYQQLSIACYQVSFYANNSF